MTLRKAFVGVDTNTAAVSLSQTAAGHQCLWCTTGHTVKIYLSLLFLPTPPTSYDRASATDHQLVHLTFIILSITFIGITFRINLLKYNSSNKKTTATTSLASSAAAAKLTTTTKKQQQKTIQTH